MTKLPVSYFSPKLEVKSIPEKGGLGIYARQSIPEGEMVMIWGGRIITEAEFDQVPEENRRSIVQVEEDLYIVTPGDPEPVDYINHSCNANVGMRGQVVLAAMRTIGAGEEVCFDYAMTDGSPYDEFECVCGAPNCRGWITGNDWKRPELWEQYAGFFSPYLQRRIERLKKGQYDVSAGAVQAPEKLFERAEQARLPRHTA
jgi:uncharacterized protein